MFFHNAHLLVSTAVAQYVLGTTGVQNNVVRVGFIFTRGLCLSHSTKVLLLMHVAVLP
jgi:hypothetical protein